MLETITSILNAISLTPLDGVMIVVGTALVFVLFRSLESAVFKPFLEHVEQREVVTSGALFTAAQMRQKAEALRARYDQAMFEARVGANRKRAEIVQDGKTKAASIIAQAEKEAAEIIQSGRSSIAEQLQRAHAQSDTQAQDLASKLASQVDSQLTVH